MKKTILITGATDGIGLEAAKLLASQGHTLLLHGRNPTKLEAAKDTIRKVGGAHDTQLYLADFSEIAEVELLSKLLIDSNFKLDVVINNAGVYREPRQPLKGGLDVRFVVNTIAPYLLTSRILGMMDSAGRVLNVSSAAQTSVDLQAIHGHVRLNDMDAYAQSKLALIMWTRELSIKYANGPSIFAVNPGSLLASKMVKEGFGLVGNDLGIGADILVRLSTSDELGDVSGKYFDNDVGRFTPPHSDALDGRKRSEVVRAIEAILISL